MHMTDTNVTVPLSRPVTLEALAHAYEAQALELAKLRERLEEMEDIRVSEAAEARALARGEVPEPFDPIADLDLTPEDIAEEAALYAAERDVVDSR